MNNAVQRELGPFLQFLTRSCEPTQLRHFLMQGESPWAHDPRSGVNALTLIAAHGRNAAEAIEVWTEFAGDLSERPWPTTHPHPLQCILSVGPAAAALILEPLLKAGLPVMDKWRGGGDALTFLFPEGSPQAHMQVYARWQAACLLGKYEAQVAHWHWRHKPLWVAALDKQYAPEELLEGVLTWKGLSPGDLDWRRAGSELDVEMLVPWAQQRFGPVLKAAGVPLAGTNTDGIGIFSAFLRALARQQRQSDHPFAPTAARRKLNFPRKRIEWMTQEGMVNWLERALDGATPLDFVRMIAWENPEDAQDLLVQWQLKLLEEGTAQGGGQRGRL